MSDGVGRTIASNVARAQALMHERSVFERERYPEPLGTQARPQLAHVVAADGDRTSRAIVHSQAGSSGERRAHFHDVPHVNEIGAMNAHETVRFEQAFAGRKRSAIPSGFVVQVNGDPVPACLDEADVVD